MNEIEEMLYSVMNTHEDIQSRLANGLRNDIEQDEVTEDLMQIIKSSIRLTNYSIEIETVAIQILKEIDKHITYDLVNGYVHSFYEKNGELANSQ